MQTTGKKKTAFVGYCLGGVYLTAFVLLLFVSYVIVSKNFQKLMTDYTFKLMQSMVDQGLTTVEYELQMSRTEAESHANSISGMIRSKQPVDLSAFVHRTDVLRLFYVSSDGTLVSDGQERDIRDREDVVEAYSGKTSSYGPYFNENNEYVICYCAPVYVDGRIEGVAGIEKDGYIFSSIIQGLSFIKTGETYIINEEGTDIAVSRPEHSGWVAGQYNAGKMPAGSQDAVARSILELEQKGFDGSSTGRGTYYWNDGLCHLFYAPIPSTHWVLLVGLRQDEIHAMTQSTLYASVLDGPVLIICVAVFLMLTLAIIVWIILSLRKTTRLNENLEIRANQDPLTGTMNRNSYNIAVDTLASGRYQSLACIYMDANGLHEINNYLGHKAGDQMLKDVAQTLQTTFNRSYVYRIGGDEFVVFCINQNKQDVLRKTERVQKNLKKQGYEISAGIEWRDQDIDVKNMVSIAEHKMQTNKQNFYKANGKERQLRTLNQELEQILLEKQDADTFLSVLAPEFKGVYFVNLSNDSIRHLFIPSYFQEILEETKDKFSKALLLYARRIVGPDYCQQFEKFCDYVYLETLLTKESKPEFIYQKRDGTWIKLQILKFKTYTLENRETLWIFEEIGKSE